MEQRRLPGAALVITLAIGTASRLFQAGSALSDKYLGDALYAVAIYLVLAMLAPDRSAKLRAALTTAAVVAVECFQLTGWPADWRDDPSIVLRALSVVLGTKFGWWDMVAYLVGIAAIWILDRVTIERSDGGQAQAYGSTKPPQPRGSR